MNRKKKNIKNVLIAFILLLSGCLHLQGQNLEEVNQLAESHYNAGHKDAALDFYMRVIYFDDDEVYTKKALLNTANIYFVKEQYDRAALFYGRSALYYQGDMQTQIYQQKISSYLLDHKYMEAYEEILHIDTSTLTNEYIKKNYFLQLATIHYGLKSYDEAKENFNMLVPDSSYHLELNKIIKRVKKVERKSSALAFYMSAVFPGSGQMYAQDYADGLNSFLLTTGLFAVGVYTGINISWIDAALIVAPWWSRYHLGGMYNTAESVRKYKVNKRSEYYKMILDMID